MKFRVTLRRVIESPLPGRIWELERQFDIRPTYVTAVKINELYVDNDVSIHRWTVPALLGESVTHYSKQDIAFFDRPVSVKIAVNQVKELVRRFGIVETYWAIKAVWNQTWIKGDRLGFLLNQNLYAKHILPVVAEIRIKGVKPKGEQAEWAGSRKEGSGSERIAL